MFAGVLSADPCGMVPPVYVGDDVPIARIGEQKTYVFFKDGVETVVIRPGFEGKVDEFGMLIPFPSVPDLRKVSDNVFPHIAAAIDPPEVVIDVRVRQRLLRLNSISENISRGSFKTYSGWPGLDRRKAPVLQSPGLRKDSSPGHPSKTGCETTSNSRSGGLALQNDQVRVVKQEAVGMYEVAVLEAGSAAALKQWVTDHGFKYPDGMDVACNDYVKQGWCGSCQFSREDGHFT